MATSDLQPTGCVICGEECCFGALCRQHQRILAQAAWVDEGLVGDWAADVGSERLKHRTMMTHPPLGRAAKSAATCWLEQFAIIVRRFGYWVGWDREVAADSPADACAPPGPYVDGDSSPRAPWSQT